MISCKLRLEHSFPNHPWKNFPFTLNYAFTSETCLLVSKTSSLPANHEAATECYQSGRPGKTRLPERQWNRLPNKGVGFRPASLSTTAALLGLSATNVSTSCAEESGKEKIQRKIPRSKRLVEARGQRRSGMTDSRRQRGGSASNNHLLQLRNAEELF